MSNKEEVTFQGDIKAGLKALHISMADAFTNSGTQVFVDCCVVQHLFDSIADPDEQIAVLASQLDDVNKALADRTTEIAGLLDRVSDAEAKAGEERAPLDVATGIAFGEAFPDEAALMADLQHSNGLQAEEIEILAKDNAGHLSRVSKRDGTILELQEQIENNTKAASERHNALTTDVKILNTEIERLNTEVAEGNKKSTPAKKK